MPEVSIVMPVLNEVAALPGIVRELRELATLQDQIRIREIVFVDDGSNDGSREYLLKAAQETALPPEIRLCLRDRAEGTLSAEIAGFRAARCPLVVKLDADGQHPPSFILDLVSRVSTTESSLVVASRYLPGGGVDWERHRGVITRVARAMAHLILPPSRKLTDPLSGYFLASKSLVEDLPPRLDSYKLLLYIVASKRVERVDEVPFGMTSRKTGESKIVGGNLSFVLNFGRELVAYMKVYYQRKSRAVPTY